MKSQIQYLNLNNRQYYQNLIKKEKYELYIDNYQLPRTIQYEKMYENLEDF